MSSPSSQPENAAPPALLSREAQQAAVAVPDPLQTLSAPAGAEVVSGQDADFNPPPVVSQSSQSLQSSQSSSSFSSSSEQPSALTPPIRPSSRDADQALVKDDIKARGPGQHNQRQPGASLLTQALASARGIPRGQKQNNSNNNTANPTPAPYDGNDSSDISSSSSSRSINNNNNINITSRSSKIQSNGHLRNSDREYQSANPSSHTASRSAHVKNGEQPASIDLDPSMTSSAMAASAMIPAAAVAIPPRDPTVIPRQFHPSNLAHAREMLLEHRDFLDRARGRASTSLDLDRSATDMFKTRAFSLSTSPEESTTQTKSSYLSNDPLQSSSSARVPKDATLGDESRLSHRPTLEQKMTISPEKTEKIWSIGSGEGEQEDGLVEKSVAEAMAGVEPNARSRKASYSLRFFKEALPPEDKPRRKDTKTTPRDKLSPTWEEAAQEGSAIATPPGHRNEQQSAPQVTRGGDTDQSVIDYFNIESTDAATPSDKTPGAARTKLVPESHEATVVPIPPPSEVGPPPASQADSVEGQRRSADDQQVGELPTGSVDAGPETETGDSRGGVGDRVDADADTEDADESGEEKISSAVFMPHQEMPDARVAMPDIASSTPTQRPRSISQSSAHPWLVKADEPEPEPELHDEDEAAVSTEAPPAQPCENLVVPGLELQEKPVEVVVAAEPVVVKSQPVPKPPPTVTQYEDHVHQHQHHPRQPLEAIELIPYKHQVGGHTTLWRFSRRAVCKQLNNRENEFYETIERYHRDLLPFLPR